MWFHWTLPHSSYRIHGVAWLCVRRSCERVNSSTQAGSYHHHKYSWPTDRGDTLATLVSIQVPMGAWHLVPLSWNCKSSARFYSGLRPLLRDSVLGGPAQSIHRRVFALCLKSVGEPSSPTRGVHDPMVNRFGSCTDRPSSYQRSPVWSGQW